MSDLRSRVTRTITEVLDLDEADRKILESGGTGQTIAAWDSARHVEIIVALEDAFSITIEAQAIARLNSVEKIVEYLQNHST